MASDESASEAEFFSGDDPHSETDDHNLKLKLAFDDKDSDEEDLERLVFGNEKGFLEQLHRGDDLLELYGSAQSKDLELARTAEDDGLENVDDAELFMLDLPGAPAAGALAKGSSKGQKTASATETGNEPAWEDSDDERLSVSLANATRLRKLRITEAEDIVSGSEYTRRLRQQFLRLNPQPQWVSEAEGRPVKRRRTSTATSDSDASSDDAHDGSDISALPLEKFLRDVRQLAGAGVSKKRRLRPEVIDIQRTRDIPGKHKAPVNSLSFHPHHPVLLSASTASVLHLNHIDPAAHPQPNPLLTSVQAQQVDVPPR